MACRNMWGMQLCFDQLKRCSCVRGMASVSWRGMTSNCSAALCGKLLRWHRQCRNGFIRLGMSWIQDLRSRQLSWNEECGLNLKLFTAPFLQTNMIMLFMPRHAQHVNSQMCLHWSSAHLCRSAHGSTDEKQ